MTGEVTLRGKVLEIGGVKEKVLAAYRAGLREVIMPKSNEKDLRDVPDEVQKNMAFTFVERMDEVLHLALLRPSPRVGGSARARASTVITPSASPADRVAPSAETVVGSDRKAFDARTQRRRGREDSPAFTVVAHEPDVSVEAARAVRRGSAGLLSEWLPERQSDRNHARCAMERPPRPFPLRPLRLCDASAAVAAT